MAADNTAEFLLKLKDEMSGSVESATQALKKLQTEIVNEGKALADMQKAMRNLKAAGQENTDQFKSLKASIDAKISSIGKLQSAYVELGGKFGSAGTGAKSLKQRMAELVSESSKLPGPLGQIGSAVSSLITKMGGLGPAVVAAGFLAIGAAAVVATGALLSYGVAVQDTRRDELLQLEGMTKLRSMWGFAGGNAKEMQDSLDEVAASSALGRDELAGLQKELYGLGLRGGNLSSALQGVAIKTSTQGKAAGAAFAQMAAGANLMGQSVTKMTDRVKSQLGGLAQKQMLSLTVQAKKQKEAYNSLFGNIKIEPFLAALKMVLDLFGQGTAAGRGLKEVITGLLQPLLDGITKLAPQARAFFDGLVLGALDVEYAFILLGKWWDHTFGDDKKHQVETFEDTFDLAADAVKGITGALTALGVLFAGKFALDVLGTLGKMQMSMLKFVAKAVIAGAETAVAWAPVVAEFALMALPWILAAAALWGFWQILKLVYTIWDQLDWTDIGRNLWKGIVDGITAGYTAIKNAVSGLAKAAMDTLKSVLESHSPSKVFARIGLEIPAGVEQGIDQGAPAVSDAAADLVTVPSAPAAAGGGGRAAGGGVTITIGEIVIQSATDKPRDLAMAFRRELESVLESVALQLGAPAAGTPAGA
jgi:hypothetical protein